MKTYNENIGFSKRIAPIFFGIIIGIVACIIALLGFSVLLTSRDFPQKAVYPLAVIAAGIGSFAGGFASGRKAKENGLLYGTVCGIALFLITFLIGFSLFKDLSAFQVVVRAAVIIIFAAIGGIVSVNVGVRNR